ncbi:MAG: protein translocase subunit SecD, partial [Treponema sp.]|nr:protein translocase subunit SecD [Treponema sp.]
MNKRSRFILILAVLALCFVFLWPSIKWYALTPKEDQALALSSLENIKDYSSVKAADDLDSYKSKVKADENTPLAEDQQWLLKIAKKNYKAMGTAMPENVTLLDVMRSFSSEDELRTAIEGHYRDQILDNKNTYKNSVKLGLDLSGGMNVIVKADLDSVVAGKDENSTIDDATLRENAMAQAIETLSGRIDRFGLSSPTIRQQGEDRIYIEIPGSAEADQINSIIQGRGILNFRLVDDDANSAFQSYYESNRASTFDSQGRLINSSLIPEDC